MRSIITSVCILLFVLAQFFSTDAASQLDKEHVDANEAYIYDAIRTPRGKGREQGALHDVTAIDLLVTFLKRLQQRHQLDTRQVDDVILGCVTPVGEQGADIARTAVLAAEWAQEIAGVQINRFCASGLEAVNLAATKVRSGWESLIVAGGVESMSRVAMGTDGGALMQDPVISERIGFVPQGISADLIATLESFSRDDVDGYALQSQQRAAHAANAGYFKSIIPVYDATGKLLLAHDEHVRPSTTLCRAGRVASRFPENGRSAFRYDCPAKISPDQPDRACPHGWQRLWHCRWRGAGARRNQGAGHRVGITAAGARGIHSRWWAPNRRLCSPVRHPLRAKRCAWRG